MKTKKRAPLAIRRAGYVGAIVVFIALWWAVGHLLEWGWPPFLTDDADRVIPWIRASLAVDIAVNLTYLFRDPRWLEAIGDSVRAAVNGVVAVAMLRIFPFDFSAYDFDWEQVTRIVLIVGIVGAWIAVIVGVVKAIILIISPPDTPSTDSQASPLPKGSPA